jgi:thiol:disulfide interchange protein DsbD
MKKTILIAIMLCSSLSLYPNPKIESVKLISPDVTVMRGDTVGVLIQFKFNRGAHSYWINNGETGIPPNIEFDIEGGAKLINMKYQIPHIISGDGITDYGYEESMNVYAKFHLPENSSSSSVKINMKADLLVCDTKCIPDSAKGSISFKVSDMIGFDGVNWKKIETIESALADMPIRYERKSEFTPTESGGSIKVDLPQYLPGEYYFFPAEGGVFVASEKQKQSLIQNKLELQLEKSMYFYEYPDTVKGIIYSKEPFTVNGIRTNGLWVEMPVSK